MTFPPSARTELLRLLGEENLHEGVGCAEYAVQGRVPSAVLFPGSLEEALGCTGVCFRHGLALTPWGGGTRMGFGRPPARVDVVLCTARMDRVVDYQPADMTVTVEAGITLARLQEVLGERGQFLPLDPPFPKKATLGGIVAARDTGTLRHFYGSPRDLLIGLRVADPEGEVVRGGSKVVKNVAGYDLPKLYTGSWGTLGLLTELTFRVLPLPERRETVTVSVPDYTDAETILAAAMDSDLMPSFIEMANLEACVELLPDASPGITLVFGIDGATEDVEWQIDFLAALAKRVSGSRMITLEADAGTAFRRTAADFPLAIESRFTARIGVRSSDVWEVIRHFPALEEANGCRLPCLAHAGVGILIVHAAGEGTPAGDAEALLTALRKLAATKRGRVTVERAISDLEGRIDPWPDFGDGQPVMEDLKRSLDPKNLWNPGRFVIRP